MCCEGTAKRKWTISRDTDEVAGESRELVKDFTFHYAPYIFSVCVCVWEFHIAEHLFMPYFISKRLMCSHEKHISAFPCNELTKWCYCSVKMTSLKWTKQIDLAFTWDSQMKEENADVNVHVHYNLYQSKLYRPPPDRKCLSVYAMPRINNTQKRRYETNKKASIHNKFPLT